MVLKKRHLILLVILSISCKFSPSGEHFIETETEVDPVTGNITIDPFYLINDTAYVFDTILINYSFDVGEKDVYDLDIWFDDDSLNRINRNFDLSNTIYYSTSNLADGLHYLNIRLQTTSGRGTISDQLGIEFLNYRVSIPLRFDNHEPPTPTPISTLSEEHGQLAISWLPYVRPRFYSYNLVRRSPQAPNNISIHATGLRDDTKYLDESYIGGTAFYSLGIRDDVFGAPTYSDTVTYVDSYPTFTSADTVGSNLVLTWSTCKYPSSFNSYVISNITTNEGWTIREINDTTLTTSLDPFDRPQVFTIRTTPKLNPVVGTTSDTLRVES